MPPLKNRTRRQRNFDGRPDLIAGGNGAIHHSGVPQNTIEDGFATYDESWTVLDLVDTPFAEVSYFRFGGVFMGKAAKMIEGNFRRESVRRSRERPQWTKTGRSVLAMVLLFVQGGFMSGAGQVVSLKEAVQEASFIGVVALDPSGIVVKPATIPVPDDSTGNGSITVRVQHFLVRFTALLRDKGERSPSLPCSGEESVGREIQIINAALPIQIQNDLGNHFADIYTIPQYRIFSDEIGVDINALPDTAIFLGSWNERYSSFMGVAGYGLVQTECKERILELLLQ